MAGNLLAEESLGEESKCPNASFFGRSVRVVRRRNIPPLRELVALNKVMCAVAKRVEKRNPDTRRFCVCWGANLVQIALTRKQPKTIKECLIHSIYLGPTGTR